MVSYTATIKISVKDAEDDEFAHIADVVQQLREYLGFEGEEVSLEVTSELLEEDGVAV